MSTSKSYKRSNIALAELNTPVEKIKQTQVELESHLAEQLRWLAKSADSFDDGDFSEAKRMALGIRILLHDSRHSKSLLGQLGLKETTKFLDTSMAEGSIGPYTGLVLKSIGPKGGTYIAPLDDLPPACSVTHVSFSEFWNKVIFVDTKDNRFTRQSLILAIADKDGGAHVDPELNEDYDALTKKNSLGWVYGNTLESGPLGNASPAAVRQITHEILKTLVRDYPKKKMVDLNGGAVFGDIHIVPGFNAGVLVNKQPLKEPFLKVGRNEKCPCGSGVKYKRCHGSV